MKSYLTYLILILGIIAQDYDGIVQNDYSEHRCSRQALESGKLEVDPYKAPVEKIESDEEHAKHLRFKKAAVTYAELNAMSFAELANTIETLEWSDIEGIFQYSEDVRIFYTNEARMNYLRNELRNRGNSYTASDQKAIRTFQELIRAGYFLAGSRDELSSLRSKENTEKLQDAITAITRNPNFRLGTREQREIIVSVQLLTQYYFDQEIYNAIVNLVKQFNSNVSSNIEDFYIRGAFWAICNGLEQSIRLGHYRHLSGPEASPFFNNINAIMDEFDKLNRTTVPLRRQWVIDSSIYWTGLLRLIAPIKSLQHLTRALNHWPKWNRQAIEAVFRINQWHNATDANGVVYNIETVINEFKAQHFPNKAVLDEGKFTVNYPNNVSESELKKLYWASKEVKAQFHRLNRKNNVVSPELTGDENLTIYIYADKYIYDANRFINGINTNNGGIYIENQGTFYTWQRKVPEESTLSLEELFRHEYCHYLQGRFQAPGPWSSGGSGSSDLYAGGRMNWFEEGQAEFLAGSTRDRGVIDRLSQVQNVRNDGRNMTPRNVFDARYSDGFFFYSYSAAFWNYLYNNRMDIIFRMLEFVRAGNGTDLSNYLNTIANTTSVVNGYSDYIAYWRNTSNNFINPVASDDYVKNTTAISTTAIRNTISSGLSLSNTNISTSNSDDQRVFQVTGKLTRSTNTSNEQTNWNTANTALDNFLDNFNSSDWNGYSTTTATLLNYSHSGSSFTYDVIVTGLLSNTDGTSNISPTASFTAPSSANVGQSVSFNSSASNDPDGNISSRAWEFGDGNTSSNTNPNHSYSSSGTFSVKLTVTDNDGASNSVTKTITINNPTNPGGTFNETENNGSFANANGPVPVNTTIVGAITSSGDRDFFYFEIANADTEIEMDLDIISGTNNLLWILYHESNLSQSIRWGSPSNDRGKFNLAQAGRYYIRKYTYSGGGTSSYHLTVRTDAVQPPSDFNEVEPNRNIADANGPVGTDQKIIGKINQDRDIDNFYIDINSPRTMDLILTTNISFSQITWTMYHESDLNSFHSWGTRENSTQVTRTVNFDKTGKYYVRVYTWADGTPNYDIKFSSGTGAASPTILPTSKDIASIYPNPFNPSTTISLSLKNDNNVSVLIYNLLGQVVNTVVTNAKLSGNQIYQWKWDGKNNSGTQMSSGIYFVKIFGQNLNISKRITLIK